MKSVCICDEFNLPVGGFGLFKNCLQCWQSQRGLVCMCVDVCTCVRMSARPRLCSGNRALNAPANRVPCRFKVNLIFQLPIDGPCVCVCFRETETRFTAL